MDIRLLTTHILATDVLSTNILYNFCSWYLEFRLTGFLSSVNNILYNWFNDFNTKSLTMIDFFSHLICNFWFSCKNCINFSLFVLDLLIATLVFKLSFLLFEDKYCFLFCFSGEFFVILKSLLCFKILFFFEKKFVFSSSVELWLIFLSENGTKIRYIYKSNSLCWTRLMGLKNCTNTDKKGRGKNNLIKNIRIRAFP